MQPQYWIKRQQNKFTSSPWFQIYCFYFMCYRNMGLVCWFLENSKYGYQKQFTSCSEKYFVGTKSDNDPASECLSDVYVYVCGGLCVCIFSSASIEGFNQSAILHQGLAPTSSQGCNGGLGRHNTWEGRCYVCYKPARTKICTLHGLIEVSDIVHGMICTKRCGMFVK